MTAHEILVRQEAIDKDMDNREEAAGQDDTQRYEIAMLGVCWWMAELSLQLAQLNENRKRGE